jgi:hypothetical protein
MGRFRWTVVHGGKAPPPGENLVPLAAGLIIGIGDVTLAFSDTFELSGIALGTIVAVVGFHAVRLAAPDHLQPAPAELQDT